MNPLDGHVDQDCTKGVKIQCLCFFVRFLKGICLGILVFRIYI